MDVSPWVNVYGGPFEARPVEYSPRSRREARSENLLHGGGFHRRNEGYHGSARLRVSLPSIFPRREPQGRTIGVVSMPFEDLRAVSVSNRSNHYEPAASCPEFTLLLGEESLSGPFLF